MSGSQHHTLGGVSDSERDLLRRSVRDFLSSNWPVDRAVEKSDDRESIAKLWLAMAQQGLSSLGSDATEAGLREIVLVFEELGRASCPAPLLGAVAANLALAKQRNIPLVTDDGRLANLIAKRKHLGIRVELLSSFNPS